MSRNVNYLLIIVILITTCHGSQRKLQSFLNPGCDELCKAENVTTLYLRGDGPRDTLHYLWDFVGNPSVMLAVTSPSAELRIDWDNYLMNIPGSINFTETPKYTFGIAVQKIFEFNDLNDTGLLDTIRAANINILNTKLFKWLRQNIVNETDSVEMQINGGGYSDPISNITRKGKVRIMMNGFGTLDHSELMPHMLHSENSTQIDIIFDNLETNSSFANSRFGMELLIVSEQRPYNSLFVDTMKSLDDEHTPGIFEVIELRTPHANVKNASANSAYLQWRPVSYTASSRGVSDTTGTIYYPMINVTSHPELAKNSLLYAYYGERMGELLVEKLNITMGMSGDGFYKKTNYTTWTFIVGYGVPPAERFSYLVIMIISIGVGLPALIMLGAGIYMCARRVPRRNRSLFVNS